jgi:hypothetical protein
MPVGVAVLWNEKKVLGADSVVFGSARVSSLSGGVSETTAERTPVSGLSQASQCVMRYRRMRKEMGRVSLTSQT